MAYTLRFDIRAPNNEFEYEAVIIRMEIAWKMGITSLKVYNDSQLVVNQVLGTYKTKEKPMKKYTSKVHKMKSLFGTFDIE